MSRLKAVRNQGSLRQLLFLTYFSGKQGACKTRTSNDELTGESAILHNNGKLAMDDVKFDKRIRYWKKYGTSPGTFR